MEQPRQMIDQEMISKAHISAPSLHHDGPDRPGATTPMNPTTLASQDESSQYRIKEG